MTPSLRTPLDGAHARAGARFTTFAGWRLPLHYGSILREARSVRGDIGMFDVSHMGRVRVRGPRAFEVLQGLGTNDLRRIGPGRAQYTVWCNPDGGAVDDLVVFWVAPDDFLVVMNASRHHDDLAHLTDRIGSRGGVMVVDETDDTAMIAVQGPRAREVVAGLGAGDVLNLGRFHVARATVAGVASLVSRTGYTGEDGVELVCEAGAALRLWEALLERGATPCGLGARDALRMEMGYPLYGHELGPDISPLEAGLGFAVVLEGRDFVGADALRKQREDGPPRRLAGLVGRPGALPQPGDSVDGGAVTSGGTSVVLGLPIGLALVGRDTPWGPATLLARGREVPCELRPVPLIERRRPKGTP